eukprot:scaffold7039_cov255-Pinguiococcus_pyrenoidosus.AAC.10
MQELAFGSSSRPSASTSGSADLFSEIAELAESTASASCTAAATRRRLASRPSCAMRLKCAHEGACGSGIAVQGCGVWFGCEGRNRRRKP